MHSSVVVPAVTIDDVLAGQRLDIAKIDVEGAEDSELRGMSKALSRSSGPTLFVECHPAALVRSGTSPAEWLAAMRKAGSLEVIDDARRQVLPASDEEIARLLEQLGGWPFNVRWRVGET